MDRGKSECVIPCAAGQTAMARRNARHTGDAARDAGADDGDDDDDNDDDDDDDDDEDEDDDDDDDDDDDEDDDDDDDDDDGVGADAISMSNKDAWGVAFATCSPPTARGPSVSSSGPNGELVW